MSDLIHPALKPASEVHFFDSTQGSHLLVVDGSKIYDVNTAMRNQLRNEIANTPTPRKTLQDLGLVEAFPKVSDTPPTTPAVRAMSLAVAQTCNLGCTYCYADGGDFGGTQNNMPWHVARKSIDTLIQSAKGEASSIMIAYLGGEPLINRDLIRRATRYAVEQASEHDLGVGFSLTTNATLLRESDFEFFNNYKFAVTVSIDGTERDHNKVRPYKGGRGSYQKIVTNLKPIFESNLHSQFSARISVTPSNLRLLDYIDELSHIGFSEIGFSPVLKSPTGYGELSSKDINEYLHAMIQCGDKFIDQALKGLSYPFANMLSALKEIHHGTHRPYPCGAGAGYLGVSAEGKYFACHRFVNDANASMGSINHGIDDTKRDAWLQQRHVHRQQPCNTCWARYLCGGGCHHEALGRGRVACDMIRGWLSYCLSQYAVLLKHQPNYFEDRI